MGQKKKQAGIPVFYSYAPVDSKYRDQLATHLSQLKRDELIKEWDNQLIPAGSERAQTIDQAIHSARLILLLVSADFLASDSCYDVEMQRALERHHRGEAHVIPVIVRPCDWQHSPFAHLQYLPRNRRPISTWDDQDEAFLSITKELRQIIEQRQNRERLLKGVRATWIEGLLEQSLHRAIWIDLHLQEQLDALENPWRLQAQELDHPPCPLPVGTSIVEVYDEADGELLILGEPGSGKTTLLLRLARTLLDRAEADERQRMPVVFHLSSWAHKQEGLAIWLVEELKTKYHVPREVGEDWIKTNQVLPLLDGLDEVAEGARLACMQAIIAYYRECPSQSGAPMVVCCRTEEYRSLSPQLPFQRAISILPLTREQVDGYLSSARGRLEVLRQALNDDADLYQLACRPLMLNIFMLAYQGTDSAELPVRSTHEERVQTIFGSYVKRMLDRRAPLRSWNQEQFLHWLVCIARKMHRQEETIFSINTSYAESDWLQDSQQGQYQRHLTVVNLLLFGLLLGLTTGLALIIRLIIGGGGDCLLGVAYIGVPIAAILIGPNSSISRYLVLRWWLWRLNYLPWNVSAFLDEAAERLLLHKVGDDYIFIHRMLLEYLATLDGPDFISASEKKEREESEMRRYESLMMRRMMR